MKQLIENYVPQIANKQNRRRAFTVWSVSILAVFVWILLILLAPLAEAGRFTGFSDSLYNFFAYFCHQDSSRSFQLENHAFAVCARCFGIYFGLLTGFAVYPFFNRIENVGSPRRVWLVAAMIPMAVDWSLGYFGIWANTHWSRFSSGTILGTVCAVFLLPALIELFEILANRNSEKSRWQQ